MNLDAVSKAAEEALRRIDGAAGEETDPDLALYSRLKPSDFPKLIQKYGTEETLSYIAAMERKLKEKEGNHANLG